MSGRAAKRGVSATTAKEHRELLMLRLNGISPDWRGLSDEELSRLLIENGIETATGKKFWPERVRDFRRAMAKAAASDFYTSSSDPAGAADALRRTLLKVIEELREPVTPERHAELSDLVTWCSLSLLEDRFRHLDVLYRALAVAEKSLARRKPMQS